jgi:hypothetical protein
MSPFESSLVVAIVQDQARRGLPLDRCPEGSAAQLAMVPRSRRLERQQPRDAWLDLEPLTAPRHAWHTARMFVALLATQLLLLWYILH